MEVTYLNSVELFEEWFASNPAARMKTGFVSFQGTSPTYSTLVYMVLDENGIVGAHTDSFEEVIVVLEGTVELTIGTDKGVIQAGGMVLVPANVQHALHNPNSTRASAIGFFATPGVVTTFKEPLMPSGANMFGAPAID